MRKSVKLAAVTTLAALAMVGASATAASAGGKDHHRDRGDRQVQVCTGEVSVVNAEAEKHSWASAKNESEDAHLNVLNCQNGEDNEARQDVDAEVAAEIENSFNRENDGKRRHHGHKK